MRFALIQLLLVCPLPLAAEPANVPTHPETFVVGISPFLDNAVKDDVYRGLVHLLVQDLPLNSSITVFDSFNLETVASLTIPDSHAFESPKTRANQFSGSINQLKRFLAVEHPRPFDSKLKFQSAVRLPQFLDFLSENLPQSSVQPSVLIIGSPLYEDQKEPVFSMVDGYFPSDGHLQATRDKSVFGLADEPAPKRHLIVHWVYFGDPWVSELHRDKVTRFWTLYVQGRGGELVTFCGDLPTAMDSFERGPAAAGSSSRQWTLDPHQTKVEMLRIGRAVDVADWIQRDSILEPAQGPPSVLVGPLKIGIRWKDNIDLDLYSSPRPGAQTLFFQHTRSPEGYYYKDHRSSPGREFEFIEFETPVDARQVDAFVNFYKGNRPGGPRGEVRIEFDNKIYSAGFVISSSEGNRGRTGPSQEDCWTRIPVQEILKISRTD
ncbi:MAG TPA: hypothetical protein VKY92_19890 [Verrucomicrobiae bacterium]|nr:hypothetical protein [Verrucomicrobiae bacterium]